MYISTELLLAYFQYLFNEYKRPAGLGLEMTSMFNYDNDLIVNKTILNYYISKKSCLNLRLMPWV